MPHWALGRLMDLAVDLAGMTRSLHPPTARKTIVTMAGDHGVAAEGVSKYPQEVTGQMVHGFAAGMAGINALGRLAGARVVVVDMGVAADLGPLVAAGKIISETRRPRHRQHRPRAGHDPRAGRRGHRGGHRGGPSRWPTRPTCSAPATWASPTPRPRPPCWPPCRGEPVAALTGRGTGIDDGQLARKIAVVESGLGDESPRSARRARRAGQGGRLRDRRHGRPDPGRRRPPQAGPRRRLHFHRRRPDRPIALPRWRRNTSSPPIAAPSRAIGPCNAAWARSRSWTSTCGWAKASGAALAMHLVDAAQLRPHRNGHLRRSPRLQGQAMKRLLAAIRFLTIVPLPGDLGHGRVGPGRQRALFPGGRPAAGGRGRRAGLGTRRTSRRSWSPPPCCWSP